VDCEESYHHYGGELMSIESWKQEYYTDPSLCTNDRERAEHTKLKYIGARKENLDRHEVAKERGKNFILDNVEEFSYNGDSCSFCIHHSPGPNDTPICSNCPLDKKSNSCEYHHGSAWWQFCSIGNPEPMITLMDTILSKCDEDGVYRQ